MEGRRARCREAALCTSCLATKSSTHTCGIQKCTLCFGPHNILLCPIAALEKDVEGDEESIATYSSAQVAENLFVLAREGARGNGTRPVKEATEEDSGRVSPSGVASSEPPPGGPALGRDVSGRRRLPSNSGATPDQGPPGTGHPVEALQAGGDHGTPHEEEEEEKELMYAASNEEEFDEPDVIPAVNPPIVGHTIPLRIPTPTEEEVVRAAATATHPPGPCHPVLCCKEGMKYCLIDEVNVLKKIRKVLQKDKGTETECPMEKGGYTLEEEHAILEKVNEEMDKELIRKEKKKVELERRLQEVERKRKVIEAKYEAVLDEHILMQTRVNVIVDDNASPEEGKSTTTEEWNQELDEEDSEPDHLGKDLRDVEPSSSSSDDETRRIEKKVVNFLKNSWNTDDERGVEVKEHLKSVKRTIENKESSRGPKEKDGSSNSSWNMKGGIPRPEEEFVPRAKSSSGNSRQNLSREGTLPPPVRNQEILATMGEQFTRREESNAKKRKPETAQRGEPLTPSRNQVESKRRRACFEHTRECQRNREPEVVVLSDTEENAPDQDKDNRLELILEKARLKREVEIQEESHRRQMSSLRQEVLLNQSLVQSMLKEVQVKNERILELELKAVRATILRKEGGVPREQGGSPTHGNSALMATISTRRPQGPQDPNSTVEQV